MWVKTLHGCCSRHFKKGTITWVYGLHSVLVKEHCAILESSSHDRGLLHQKMMTVMSHLRVNQTYHCFFFFGAGPDKSSAEADEMDSWDNYEDGKKNEGGQVSTPGQKMGKSYPPLHRSTRWKQPSSLCDQEIREEWRREVSLPCMAKQARLCLVCRISYFWQREKKETWPPQHLNLK